MREYLVTLAVVAAGGVIVIASYAATWVTAVVPVFTGQDNAPTRDVALTGGQLVPLGAALGWLALAGAAGLLATRTWGRRIVATAVVLAGGGAGVGALAFGLTGDAIIDSALAAQGLTTPDAVTRSPWWITGIVGGLMVLVAGAVAVLRGPSWPGLSRRYERRTPAPSGPVGGVAAWDALDRGEDPTDPRQQTG